MATRRVSIQHITRHSAFFLFTHWERNIQRAVFNPKMEQKPSSQRSPDSRLGIHILLVSTVWKIEVRVKQSKLWKRSCHVLQVSELTLQTALFTIANNSFHCGCHAESYHPLCHTDALDILPSFFIAHVSCAPLQDLPMLPSNSTFILERRYLTRRNRIYSCSSISRQKKPGYFKSCSP